MSDHDIITALQRVRDLFLRLTDVYRGVRLRLNESCCLQSAEMRRFQEADLLLATAVRQLGLLPQKPGQACSANDSRAQANGLLKEITSLLQAALASDREIRAYPDQLRAPAAAPGPGGKRGYKDFADPKTPSA